MQMLTRKSCRKIGGAKVNDAQIWSIYDLCMIISIVCLNERNETLSAITDMIDCTYGLAETNKNESFFMIFNPGKHDAFEI